MDDFDDDYFLELLEDSEFGNIGIDPEFEPCTFFIKNKGKLIAIIDCESECISSDYDPNGRELWFEYHFVFGLTVSKIINNYQILGMKIKGEQIELNNSRQYRIT